MLANKAVIDLRPTIMVIELDSIVGPLLLGAQGDALCFLEFLDEQQREQQLARLSQTFAADFRPGDSPVLTMARQQLTEYFAGTRRQFDLPLRQPGTLFQSRVWQALTEIPYGATCSYGAIARNIGQPQAMRAVGMANGRNHIPIIVPCHRVVNSDGSLGGFSSGLWRKEKLLELEARTSALI